MKRALAILCIGVLGAISGYFALYLCATSPTRSALRAETPELSWLKQEFNLNDAQFQHICDLHAGYLPKCREMCGRIAAKNEELKAILAQTNAVTPEIEKKLAEIAQVRAQCQMEMLAHFYAVSRAMPPEQGRRYLDWIEEQTLGGGGGPANAAGHHMQ